VSLICPHLWSSQTGASRYDARLSSPDEKSAHRLSAQRAVDRRDRPVDHAIGALAIGLIYLLTQVIAFLQPILVPFAVAGVLAYLLEPGVEWLERRGLNRQRSVLLAFRRFHSGHRRPGLVGGGEAG
jgi:hypothetical protein